jgi:hypothetical protein
VIPLDEVCLILKEAGEPLHYQDIADRLIRRGVWTTKSSDPHKVLDSFLASYIRQDPKNARIHRFDWGIYGLKPEVKSLAQIAVQTASERRFQFRSIDDTLMLPRPPMPRFKSKHRSLSPQSKPKKAPKIKKPPTPTCDYPDAAEKVLHANSNRTLMIYQEIAIEARRLGLINGSKANCIDKMAVALYSEYIEGQRNGDRSRFVFYGDNRVGLH